MSELRMHCPFCGSDRTEIRAPRMSLRFIECVKCGARGPKSYDGSDEAVALWNKRATLAPVIQLRPERGADGLPVDAPRLYADEPPPGHPERGLR